MDNYIKDPSKLYDKYKTISSMDEYLLYLNTIKKIQYSNSTGSLGEFNNYSSFKNNYKKNRDNKGDRDNRDNRDSRGDRDGSFVKNNNRRFEKKDYKDLDDPENSYNNRNLISYDDL